MFNLSEITEALEIRLSPSTNAFTEVQVLVLLLRLLKKNRSVFDNYIFVQLLINPVIDYFAKRNLQNHFLRKFLKAVRNKIYEAIWA